MEVSTDHYSLVSNNCYESHALFTLLETVEASPSECPADKLKVELTDKESFSNDNTLFINWQLIILAVTARGSFNVFINAVFAKLLKNIGWNVKKMIDVDQLCVNAQRLCEESPRHVVDLAKYRRFLETYVWGNPKNIEESIQELTTDMWFSVMNNNKESLKLIEKLLVGLLGHQDGKIRDLAVVHLNAFYDDTDWQIIYPLKPKVTTVGQEFCIREVVEMVDKENVVLELHAPGFYRTSKNYVLSFHVPEIRNMKEGAFLKVDLGKFIRCGFYDWRFSEVRNGALHPLMNTVPGSVNTSPVQGRFIVHPAEVKNLQIHEIFIDFQDAKFDVHSGRILQRGTFSSVKSSLRSRYASGINCLYLMGALERDTGTDFDNPNASPLALICRSTACSLLGGGTEFKSMMREAKEVGMKILIDCVARISSKNYHRRYKNQMLFFRNPQGIPVVCYGSDGRAINYEDSAMLNYRNSEVWQLLVDDILDFTRKYQVDGIHIDNAHSWPQIMELDSVEMYRKDPDGQPHYSTQEIFDGIIVKRNEFFAYWASELRDKYANPLFVKLCKELWRECPEFYIVADVWTGSGMEERGHCIANSGPVPRLYDLPVRLSALFGKKLHKNGTLDNIERKDVSLLKKWCEEMDSHMPQGAIIVQSSTGHSLPYPALLYGRGAWAAVDVLFFLPFIPITFIGEQDGHAYRSKINSLYDFDDESRPALLPSSISTANLTEVVANLPKTVIPRVASTTSFTVIPDIKELEKKESSFQKELGPEVGFDITKIKLHYKHRREIRAEREVLRYGDLIPLVFKHDHGWHKQVIAFARCLPTEVAVILINLNEHPVVGYADLSGIQKYLTGEGTCVYSCSHWLENSNEEYFFKEEIFMDRHYSTIAPYRSNIFSILPSNVTSQQCLSHSLRRLKYALENSSSVEGNYLIHNLDTFINSENFKLAVPEIINTIGIINKEFLEKFSISPHHLVTRFQKMDDKSLGKLFGVCDFLLESQGISSDPRKFAEDLVKTNRMGPIVFGCPEIGRFSTVGGLGVMVDELAQGLAALGEEVWVISPYYDKNKKGETGYLAKDKARITWRFNFDIQFGGESYTIGLHQGWENGVNLVFVHNAILFPVVYADGKQQFIMRQLVGFGKSVLEALCRIKVIPAVLVTNDWFTGLVAAYAKMGAFGQTFEGTTFMHIIHNLDPSYEGRIFPTSAENFFMNIHGINKEWLVDPYWATPIVNPSRCALKCSDQWATVSPSYRNELLQSSPLRELLRSKLKPFAFPNGIPIKQRLERLSDKGSHLDAKKVIQQKYFQFSELDDSIPIFGFVGRITEQKGVHLIIEAAEQLIPRTNYKIQFLVGGPYTPTEKYSVDCANKMRALRSRYPNNFFADPDNFFYDGPYVNLGCDFGLMPSKFEPGGIVQHEFFVAGTPVVAFKTGGLKDTVFEFNSEKKTGSGFVFETFFLDDFIQAIFRALGLFANNKEYLLLRKNAFAATIDGEVVARAWNKEFYRLKGKIYHESSIRAEIKDQLRGFKWSVNDFDDSVPENRHKNPPLKRTTSGILLDQVASAKKALPISEQEKQQFLFTYKTQGIRLQSVQLTGSFDKWQIRHPLSYDHAKASWYVTLLLPKGKFFYKFIIDGSTWVHSFDHPTERDWEET
jgi:starch synthase